MKKIITMLLAFSFLFIGAYQAEASSTTAKNFRALWVCSAYNLDWPSKKGLSNDQLKQEIETILDRAVYLGMNAVVVQVRPASDAIYKSMYFPWSETLTGTQGNAPADGFDPLAYWVERGHAKGLEVHAWINPYRITSTNQKITNTAELSLYHPARQNPTWAIAYKDALYFDPGNPDVRQLVADGVGEIVRNYKVDGIHLDDYFYPGTDFPDDKTYSLHGGGLTKEDWRRESVNSLIKLLQKTVRDINPEVRYGISPTAIWQNKNSNELGSDTRGFESYKSAYADTRRWVKENWLDYICPQVYWYIGFDIADYEKVLNWWIDVCAGTEVDLYIGHAAYREEAKETNWKPGEMIRQLEMNTKSPVVKGSIFFREKNMRGDLGDQIRDYFKSNPITTVESVSAFAQVNVTSNLVGQKLKMDNLNVAQPSKDVTVTGDHKGYNILGTAIPGTPLYMNGQLITNFTEEGFFSVFAPLSKGENRLTFTQEGQPNVVRVITLKDASVTRPPVLSTLGVSDAYPSAEEMGSPGDSITLRCTAPAGSTVTASLNGTVINLIQSNENLRNNGSTVYAAVYTGTYTLPTTASASITDIGKPIYSASFNGQRYSATASAPVKVIGLDAPLYAEITATSAWTYPNATTSGGSAWALHKGQKDRITAITENGKWTRLMSGVWVESTTITKSTEASMKLNVLSIGRYITGIHEDIIVWSASEYAATNTAFDGKKLTICFGMQRNLPSHGITQAGTMFENITAAVENGVPSYVLTLRNGGKLEGYYYDYQNGEMRLHLKKRKPLTSGDKPLTGFTFVIDPGHGGTDSGALGPMGASMSEKMLNLTNSQKLAAKLRELGANVTMVRDTDVAVDLHERPNISYRANPDMFISMHANSLVETTDATNVKGFTVWYRNSASKPLADAFMQSLYTINPLTTRHATSNQSNLFVIRPTWTPSVIIEASFMNNVDDFSWMVNPAKQDELAWGIANAILAYYR